MAIEMQAFITNLNFENQYPVGPFGWSQFQPEFTVRG